MADKDTGTNSPLIRIIDNYRKVEGDISDKEVCRRAGIGSGQMAKLRKGAKADVDTLTKFAALTGRTVGQLLGESAGNPDAPADIAMIPFSLIDAAPNPRRTIDYDGVKLLADAIFDQGLLNPLLVRPKGDRFSLIAGQRRRLAIGFLIRDDRWAPDTRVPCKVVNADDQRAETLALIENLQRDEMEPLDEGEAFVKLQKTGMSTEQVAIAVRKELRYVQSRIALVKKLPEADKAAMRDGTLSIKEARSKITTPRQSSANQRMDRATSALRRPPEPGPIKAGRAYNPHPKAIKAEFQFTSLVTRPADGEMPVELTLWDPYKANEGRYIRADQHHHARYDIRDVTWKGAGSPATMEIFDAVEGRSHAYVRADLVASSSLDHARTDDGPTPYRVPIDGEVNNDSPGPEVTAGTEPAKPIPATRVELPPTKTQAAALGVKPELQRPDLRSELDTEDMPADDIPAFLRRKKDAEA